MSLADLLEGVWSAGRTLSKGMSEEALVGVDLWDGRKQRAVGWRLCYEASSRCLG